MTAVVKAQRWIFFILLLASVDKKHFAEERQARTVPATGYALFQGLEGDIGG